jgi:hypothetical protein
MKKHRIDKIRELSGASEPEITPEYHAKNIERTVDMIMEVIDRLPANPAPVSETIPELLDQLRHGVKRQSTSIISGASTQNFTADVTKMNAKVDTGMNAKVDTFTEFELNLLEQIRQNGK